MVNYFNIKMIKSPSFIYFAIAFIFLVNEILKIHPLLNYFGQLRLFALVWLYLITSQKRSATYLGVLLFVIISNFLFAKNKTEFLAYGMIAYSINRLLTIILVYKTISEKKMLPITIATIPFLFFYLYMTFLVEELYSLRFYALLFNGLLMSFLGGLSLSNYYIDSNDYNNKNALLLISTILFVVQNLVFLLQKYYALNGFFEPTSIVLNTASLYFFYKFVILSEEPKTQLT